MKMMKINDETHKKLNKILGELTARNSEIKTFDDVLNSLIEKYESAKQNNMVAKWLEGSVE